METGKGKENKWHYCVRKTADGPMNLPVPATKSSLLPTFTNVNVNVNVKTQE